MKLKLVKQGEFLGTRCDFYVDEENNIYYEQNTDWICATV